MEAEVKGPYISTHKSKPYEFSLKGIPVKREGIILPPNENPWESKATFNAGAVLNQLLYRAFGDGGPDYSQIPEGPSSIGLATISNDGKTLTARLKEPVIQNAEDPRITNMGGWYAITYTKVVKFEPPKSFSTYPAIAISRDLRNFEELGIMEIEGLEDVSKNVVLFPKKIKGRYAALAREKPGLFVIYSDDLLHWDSPEFMMGPRHSYWDSEFIGPGDPPNETPFGWLEIYHGVDEANTYSLGIVLLDLDYPSTVLARSIHPLLEPQADYELSGIHSNVVYTCGSVVGRDGRLRVFYGAADKVLASATVPTKPLLKRMKR